MRQEHSDISRRVGTVGFFTLLSRIMGLVRDAALAFAFGATNAADAFYVAFRIPNLLRRFVAEGALTVAFVPIYTEYLKKSRKDALEAASVIFSWLSLVLVALVAGGILFAPWIVKLVAYGFSSDPAKFDLTVYLTRLMFPYILLISLVALAMGILNSLKRFAAPAASPILLNLGIIFGALVLQHRFSLPAAGVAVGVLIGGAAQLALQIPWLAKEGMLPRIRFEARHPALRGLMLLMIPSAFGAAVYQINVLVVTLLASFLPDGSVSFLWYADRVSEFPLGIFAISVATAALPTLSDHAACRDYDALRGTMNFALRLNFAISIPAAAGLYLLAGSIVRVLFERGAFTSATAAATTAALVVFAVKIPFVAGVRNLVPGFFAIKNARIPVYASTIAVVVNALVALLLMRSMAHVGLAWALVGSSAANFAALAVWFRRRIGPLGARKLTASVVRTCIATAAMTAALLWAKAMLPDLAGHGLPMRAGLLVAQVLGGAIVYLVALRIVNVEDYRGVVGMIRRRHKVS